MDAKLTGLSELEVRLAFASLCVEATAQKAGTTYKEMYDRLKRVGLIQEYVKRLDPVHTQSRDYVVDEVVRELQTKQIGTTGVYKNLT